MQDPRERLFRDDNGAALERASRLEDENRRLRAEIERLRQAGGQGFGPPPYGPPFGDQSPELMTPRRSDDRVIAAVVLGMVTLFAGVTLAARPHAGRSCGARRPAAFALQANPGIAVAGTPIRTGPAAATDPCAEPFVVADGIGLAVKAECIHPGSTLREPAPPAAPSSEARPDCNPPYLVDEGGHRRYKLDCIR